MDISEIDLILISNTKSLIGLPFITESGQFKGQIYATEPTIEFGKLVPYFIVKPINTNYCNLFNKKYHKLGIY